MIAISVTVATMKSKFGISDCVADSDICMGDFLFIQGILHVCGHALV